MVVVEVLGGMALCVGGSGRNRWSGGGSGRNGSKSMIKVSMQNDGIRVAAPLFIPATADGKLAEKLRREKEKLGVVTGWRYKVVDRSDRKLWDLPSAANILQQENCGRIRCKACRDSSKPINCRRTGLLYENFTAKYVGETSRSAMERYREHVDGARRKESRQRYA